MTAYKSDNPDERHHSAHYSQCDARRIVAAVDILRVVGIYIEVSALTLAELLRAGIYGIVMHKCPAAEYILPYRCIYQTVVLARASFPAVADADTSYLLGAALLFQV